MPIPFVQLPFARIRVITGEHQVNSFMDLPNTTAKWTLSPQQSGATIYPSMSQYVKRVHLQVDRLFRRNDPKTSTYVKKIVEAVEDLSQRSQWQEEYGAGKLDVSHLRSAMNNYQRGVDRVTAGFEVIKDGGRIQRNFLHLNMERDTYFSTITQEEAEKARNNLTFAGRQQGHNAIVGTAVVFGEETPVVVGHPYVDLRKHFGYDKIEDAVQLYVLDRFPWMIKHNLFHSLELDL